MLQFQSLLTQDKKGVVTAVSEKKIGGKFESVTAAAGNLSKTESLVITDQTSGQYFLINMGADE